MPSKNLVFEEIKKTKLNSKQDQTFFDAVVIANYGDPGLEEDYHADILSRYLICMIESSNRVLTYDKWKTMIVVVKRPEHLWIKYDGGFLNDPENQRRIDSNLNSNIGYTSSYTADTIPKINFPYKMGEKIRIKKVEKQNIFNSECSYEIFNNHPSYGSWHSEGEGFINYGPSGVMKDLLRQKTIYPATPENLSIGYPTEKNIIKGITKTIGDNSESNNQSNVVDYNKYIFYFTKTQYEVMTMNLYGSAFKGLFWPGPPKNSYYFLGNGGYYFAPNNPNLGPQDSVYTSHALNIVEYEDVNIGGKFRISSNSCLPLVVTSPNTFSIPRTRTIGTVNYSPTYIVKNS